MMNGSNYNDDFDSSYDAPYARPPPPEPMTIPGDDANPGLDRGHSLPSVQEIRLSNASNAACEDDGYNYPSGNKRKVFLLSSILALVVIIGSVGIAVGMQNQSKNDSKIVKVQIPQQGEGSGGSEQETTTVTPTLSPTVTFTVPPGTNTQQRTSDTKFFISLFGISVEKMSTEGSPHFKAVEFLAEKDALFLDVPRLESSPGSYTFLTRYVMALLYYSLRGPQWLSPLNFLRSSSVCDWHYTLLDQYGRPLDLGLKCKDGTEELQGIYLCKYNNRSIPDALSTSTSI